MELRSGSSRHHLVLLTAFVVLLAWSAYRPKERFTWVLEVAPAVVGVAVAAATYKRFRLTDMAYTCIALHAAILIVGGHYTYAEVPLGDWVRDAFGLARNHYDRLGHVAQGFFPAILVREILLRTSPLVPGKWLAFIVTCICLAISALYELLEWWVSLATGSRGDAFLGTQGDIWDTQWDMFLARCGAMAAQVMLGKWHEVQIRGIVGLRDYGIDWAIAMGILRNLSPRSSAPSSVRRTHKACLSICFLFALVGAISGLVSIHWMNARGTIALGFMRGGIWVSGYDRGKMTAGEAAAHDLNERGFTIQQLAHVNYRDCLVPGLVESPFYWVLHIPMWIPMMIPGTAALALAFVYRRFPVGTCKRCGYLLRGCVSNVCPECGTPIP